MRRTKHRKSESGQIIVIIAFLLIAMIAMLGLAIDAGGLMFLQRDVQNAVDHAIVAAVYAQCGGGTDTQVIQAGEDAAEAHGFVTGDGTVVTVTVPYQVDYIEVKITAPKPSYFIQIVYPDDLFVTARGVGRCNPDLVSAHIQTVTGMGDCTSDINISGGGGPGETDGPHSHRGEFLTGTGPNGFHLFNGSVFSNSKLGANPDVHTHPTGIPAEYVNGPGPQGLGGGTYIGPDPIVFPYLWNIDDYDKNSADHPIADLAMLDGDGVAGDGPNDKYWYYPGDVTISDPAKFNGLIFAEGDITIKHKQQPGIGDWPDQTFYVTMVSRTGKIAFDNVNGNSVYGYRSYTESLGVGDYILAFTMLGSNLAPSGHCSGNNNQINFSGNNWESSRGIIYAPHAEIKWSMSEAYFEGAIIGFSVSLNGSYIEVHFKPEMIPPIPPTGEFTE